MREDWVECKLEDIGLIYSGGTPKTNILEYWGNDISWISPSDLSKYENVYIERGAKSITKLGLEKSSAQLFPAGTVLFSSRAPIGYTVIAKNEMTTNQGFKSVQPLGGIDSKYVYYNLKFSKNKAESVATGTTFKEISKVQFSNLNFPLPPLPEQRAIIKKIEALFSSLDAGISDLKKAQEQLKIYRQAVLKKAFEGIETEKSLGEIKVDSMIGLVKSNAEQFETGLTPYIKMNNITMDGKTDIVNTVFVEATEEEKKKYNLLKGDLLINTRNSFELVGKTGIIRENLDGYVFNNNLMRLRVVSSIDPLFIFYQLIGPKLRKDMIAEKKATTSICALYQRDLFPLKVKVLPSLEEQAQIVKEIEARLSVCDAVEKQIQDSLDQAEALRQSILKKAFEGRLLSEEELNHCKQAPDYEPASVLLEKIKAEKEANKPVKKKTMKMK